MPKWAISYFISISFLFLMGLVAFKLLDGLRVNLPNFVVWLEIGILGLVVLLMIIAMVRKNFSILWWEVVLLIMALVGVWIFCLSVFPIWAGIIIAVALTLLPYIWQRTFLNAITLLVGCAGIGLLVSFQFPYIVVLVCSFAVAIYDFLRKKDFKMAGLFAEAWQIGLAPGVLIPASALDWFKPINKTWEAGTGQIVGLLPFIFMAAMSIFFLAWGYIYFIAVWLILAIIAVFVGQDDKGYLRSWVFSMTNAILFAIIGIYLKML